MSERDRLFQQIKFHVESKNYPAALRRLRQEMESSPNDAQLLFWLGVCLAEIGELSEAEQHLKHSLSVDADNKDVRNVLHAIQQKQAGEEIQRPLSAQYFDLPEPVEYKKKECPHCHRRIAVESWQCGYCHNLFWKRILIQFGIFFFVASLFIWAISGWFSGFVGYEFHPAEIVNKIGNEGKRVEVTNVEWNCMGMGLTQARGTGFDARVRGKIKNVGGDPIEKAVFTIFLQHEDGLDITFVWFDVYTWRPGEEIDFDFPAILPPARAERCELRIESVQLAERAFADDARLEFYVPKSGHFRAYGFKQGEKILADRSYGFAKPMDPWSFKKLLKVYWDILPALFANYLVIMLSVILVNICEPERKWNTEWQLDAIASAFLVIGLVAINTVSILVMSVIGMLGLFAILAHFLFRIAKYYLFYLFFKRSIGFTILMIVFYYCLVLSGAGLYYKIIGPPVTPHMPHASQMSQPSDFGAPIPTGETK